MYYIYSQPSRNYTLQALEHHRAEHLIFYLLCWYTSSKFNLYLRWYNPFFIVLHVLKSYLMSSLVQLLEGQLCRALV